LASELHKRPTLTFRIRGDHSIYRRGLAVTAITAAGDKSQSLRLVALAGYKSGKLRDHDAPIGSLVTFFMAGAHARL
jgi:hypothetical protein